MRFVDPDVSEYSRTSVASQFRTISNEDRRETLTDEEQMLGFA